MIKIQDKTDDDDGQDKSVGDADQDRGAPLGNKILTLGYHSWVVARMHE